MRLGVLFDDGRLFHEGYESNLYPRRQHGVGRTVEPEGLHLTASSKGRDS